MLSLPAISVIVPTCNGDRHLLQAVDSVLAQTIEDYELIVIDDGSTDKDDTVQILTRYQQEIPNTRPSQRPINPIRYVRQSHQGIAVARNHGLQLARGQYIVFLDADDWVTPTKLERQWAVFEANPDVGMVHSGWHRVDANGKTLITVKPWIGCPQLDVEQWLQWRPVLANALMFRKEWLIKADGFDPRFPWAEDTDLVLRLAAMGCQTAWLKDSTVYYRQQRDRASHNAVFWARSLSAVINQFFLRPALSSAIRHNERNTRFSTWTWIAWCLYDMGHPDEMVKYLKQAWQYSPHPPIDTLILWIERFAQWSKSWGMVLDTENLCQSPAWIELSQWCIATNIER